MPNQGERRHYVPVCAAIQGNFQAWFKEKNYPVEVHFEPSTNQTEKLSQIVARIGRKLKQSLPEFISDGSEELVVDGAGIAYERKQERFRLAIIEVKIGSLSLNDLSQLVGYCICSSASIGFLVGVDGQPTDSLASQIRNRRLDKLKINDRELKLYALHYDTESGKVSVAMGKHRSFGRIAWALAA